MLMQLNIYVKMGIMREAAKNSFAPTPESRGFSPALLWSGLLSGCRATKSQPSRSESAKLSGAMGLPARRVSPWGSTDGKSGDNGLFVNGEVTYVDASVERTLGSGAALSLLRPMDHPWSFFFFLIWILRVSQDSRGLRGKSPG